MNRTTILLTILALAGMPGLAGAQYQLGDGRGLDANLRQGSGGVNTPRQANTAGQYQDALVTGNVSGLASFRGDIDYGAAHEFRAELGSDDLFDFSRRSYGAPQGRGSTFDPRDFGQTSNPPGFGGQNLVFRSGTGAHAGQVTGFDRLGASGANVRYRDVSPLQRYRGVGGLENVRLRAFDRRPIGMARDDQGRLLQINSSPLTGVSFRRESPAAPAEVEPLPFEAGPELPPNEAETEARRADGAAAVIAQIRPGDDRPAADTDEQVDSPLGRSGWGVIAPTYAALGERIGAQLLPGRAARSDAAELKAFDQAMARRLEQAEQADEAQAEADVYLRMLQQIREAADQPDADADADADAGADADNADADGAASEAFGRTIEKLDYDLPAMRSLAGSTDSRFNQAMSQAEAYLSRGEYFSAEQAYSRALRLRSDHPLAVVGRAHAQLGAGLFISAAKSLRSVLAAHPELIAAKYDRPLVPGEQRLAVLRKKLTHQAKTYPKDVAAPLLLAYLSYQQGQAYATAAQLDALAQRSPNDPLVPLLRRVWLDANSTSTDVKPDD